MDHDGARGGAALTTAVDVVRCNVCSRDVSFSLFFRCRECVDMDLCTDCFALPGAEEGGAGAGTSGAEPSEGDARRASTTRDRLGAHRPTHAYCVPESLSWQADAEGWSVREELRLIKALQRLGAGNWEDVALVMGNKSAKDCGDYFYRHVAKVPLPEEAEGGAAERPKVAKRHFLSPTFSNFTGFMPRRVDFDVVYKDGAEADVCDIEFRDGDSDMEKTLKLQMLHRYNRLTEERSRRQDLLVSGSETHRKRRSTEETQFSEALKPFARFHEAEEQREMLEDLLHARKLRKRIATLAEMHAKGLRFMSEVEEALRRKKDGAQRAPP